MFKHSLPIDDVMYVKAGCSGWCYLPMDTYHVMLLKLELMLLLASWLDHEDRGTAIAHYSLLNSMKLREDREQLTSA